MNITVHANKVEADLEMQQVTVSGVDLGEIISDQYYGDVLDLIDFENILEYVQKQREESREY